MGGKREREREGERDIENKRKWGELSEKGAFTKKKKFHISKGAASLMIDCMESGSPTRISIFQHIRKR